MELREVRSFVTLAEQLHFGRAAELLHLSQPALTKQIRRLEDEIGGELLTRGRHGARLTALGHQFLRGARLLVRDADDLLERTRQTAGGQTGRLRIGFGFHTFELVPRVLVRLRKSVPTMHQHVLALCAKHGFHPRSVQEVPEVTTALALVQAGLGVTMIPQSFGSTHFTGVRFHILRDPEARWRVGAAWRKADSNPLIARFLALLKNEVKSLRA